MALENESTTTKISQLDPSEPINSLRQVRDMASQLRVLKKVLQWTFSNLGSTAVTATATALNNAATYIAALTPTATELNDTAGYVAALTPTSTQLNSLYTHAILDDGTYSNPSWLTSVSKAVDADTLLDVDMSVSQILLQNGAQYFPGSLYIQWGSTTIDSTGFWSISFPVIFPNSCLALVPVLNSTI